MTTRPPLPQLDYTLACCPACGHESVELVAVDTRFYALQISLLCLGCKAFEYLGHVTRSSRFLSAAVLHRWGVTE